MLGMAGVATAIDSIPSSYTTLAASGKVYANDSYIFTVAISGWNATGRRGVDRSPEGVSRSQ